jgi:hypothetical protein
MGVFAIKGSAENPSTLELVDETEGGFYIRIRRVNDGSEDVSDGFMTRELFDACLRTGYLLPSSRALA